MNDMLIHKSKPRSNGTGARTICGRYGYRTHLWKNTTCGACLKRKPK